MNQRFTLALLVSFCVLVSTAAQTRPNDDRDDVVKITTNLVQIDAVVTKNGKPVTNLTAEDFEIYEDGRRQTITSFAYISNLPASASSAPEKTEADSGVPAGRVKRDVARRTIAIVVDDLGLSVESLYQAKRQIRKFIAEQLHPNDLAAVIRTGGEVGVLQQFTNDKRLLNRAVDQLRWNVRSRVGMSVFPSAGGLPTRSSSRIGAQALSLGALRFVLDAMGRLPGRKSMILMSDSLPIQEQNQIFEGSREVTIDPNVTDYGDLLQRIAEKAIRSSVVIYSVDTQALQYTGPTAADSIRGNSRTVTQQINTLLASRSHMLFLRRQGGEAIAQQTGGFQVRNSNDYQLDRILEDQSGYYLLGYRPTEETFNRRFHHIKAKVKRSGMTLRTRFGFFGVTEEEANRARLSARDETNLALSSPFGAQDLELDLNSFFANGKTEGSVIRSYIHLNPENLNFSDVNDRRETSLEIHGVIFGDNGAVVEQVKHDAVLSLRENEYSQALRDGISLKFDMRAKKPGSYQVRIAVRDRTSAKIGSAGQFVAVPDLDRKEVAFSGIVLRAVSEQAANANPDIRRFRNNSDLHFAFVVYNAAVDRTTQLPNLTIETRLFRDGKSVGPTAQIPIDVKNQADLSRLFINGAVRLNSDLEPGSYYLQVIITDQAARNKQPPITQWADFEIVK